VPPPSVISVCYCHYASNVEKDFFKANGIMGILILSAQIGLEINCKWS
jgi:hypothetical protein